MKSYMAKAETMERKWYVVDAEGMVLGRLASQVAAILRGKHKPIFTPHVDCGDNVIIVNAEKVRLTGDKWNGRVYLRHTGYPGGQREYTPATLMQKGPEHLIRKVVKGMLPKNKLGNKIITNLHVFAGPEHNMQAQQPKQIDLNSLK